MPGQDIVLLAEPGPQDTVGSLLEGVGVPVDEISHVFVNARLLATRNSMAAYYGYPHTGSDLADWNLGVPVGDGDRIGVFGRDMAILGM